MKVAPYELVEGTYEWFADIEDDQEVDRLIESFSNDQPVLFTFLMTMGEGDFDGPEQEVLLFLGLLVWKSLQNAGNDLPEIGEEHLDAVQEHNMMMLEYLTEENEEGFMQVARTLMEGSPQPALLRFLVEVIFEDEAEVIRPKNQGIIFIFLKIMIDGISVGLLNAQ